jgi:hypothetical protein
MALRLVKVGTVDMRSDIMTKPVVPVKKFQRLARLILTGSTETADAEPEVASSVNSLSTLSAYGGIEIMAGWARSSRARVAASIYKARAKGDEERHGGTRRLISSERPSR